MNHLTTDEILDFVTAREADEKFFSLAGKVNSHIMHCSECLKKVRAFQMLEDEFEDMAELPVYLKKTLDLKDMSVDPEALNGDQMTK